MTSDASEHRFRRREFGAVRGRVARAGYTILDTVGMLVLIGMLFSLSSSVLHLVYQVHRDSLRYVQITRNLQTAATRFRTDARDAVRAEVLSSEVLSAEEEGRAIGVRFELPEGYAVEYRGPANRLERETRWQGAVVGTEQWQLPGAVQLVVSIDREERIPRIEMEVQVEEAGRWSQPGSIVWQTRTEMGWAPLESSFVKGLESGEADRSAPQNTSGTLDQGAKEGTQ